MQSTASAMRALMDAEQHGQQPQAQPRRSRPSRLTNEAMPQPRRSSKSVAESSDERRSSTGPPHLKSAATVRVVRNECTAQLSQRIPLTPIRDKRMQTSVAKRKHC